MRKKIIAFGIIISTLFMSACNYGTLTDGTVAESTEVREVAEDKAKERVLQAKYAVDTAYTDGDIPYELYDVAFAEDGIEYVKNKDFVDRVSDTQINKYIDTAERFTQTIFGNTARTIKDDTDSFRESLIDFHADNIFLWNGVEYDTKDLADLIIDGYTKGSVVAECELKTNNSLIFERNYVYVLRGEIDIDVKSGDIGKLEELLGQELNEKGETRLMAEFTFIPQSYGTVSEFHVISVID